MRPSKLSLTELREPQPPRLLGPRWLARPWQPAARQKPQPQPWVQRPQEPLVPAPQPPAGPQQRQASGWLRSWQLQRWQPLVGRQHSECWLLACCQA